MMKRLAKKLLGKRALPRPADGESNHNDSKTRHLRCPRCHRLLIVPTVETFRCQCGMIFRAAGRGGHMQVCFSLSDQEANDQGFGLPRELVERMPLITITQQMVDEWESAKKPTISGEELKEELVDTDKMVCRICLSDYKAGDSVRVLPCFHRFHVDEIDDWLNRNSRCPLCHLDVCEALTGSTGVAFVSTVESNPTAAIERRR